MMRLLRTQNTLNGNCSEYYRLKSFLSRPMANKKIKWETFAAWTLLAIFHSHLHVHLIFSIFLICINPLICLMDYILKS